VSVLSAVLLHQPLWVISILLQILVTVLLIRNRYYRQLPRLTGYVALNVFQAIWLLGVYARYGFDSNESRLLFWISESITVLARVSAGFELMKRVLEGYRGIWGLAWRLLAVSFLGVLAYATAETWSTWSAAAVSADRGFHLGFAVAIVSCLVRFVIIAFRYRWCINR
jgi:hypothetical protein